MNATDLYIIIYIFCIGSLCRNFHEYSEGSYTHENYMFKVKSLKWCKHRFQGCAKQNYHVNT